ncbi:MAG: transcriptional regulator [Chloroflexi bacterium]|nr:transcriptional regulator [Chloroflexota bacterium]
MSKRNERGAQRRWYTGDLHLHTPASSDFQEPEATYLDLLHRAEARGLDIIAFTDHNTTAGYRAMQEQIHQLELLEGLGRLTQDERERLAEYRRLLGRILVLPGFEFTATFGFHILAIFPPEKSVRELDHLLLSLRIPGDQLDNGSGTVGATSDVLTAYRMINDAGGLVIAAHANSANGVAMRGFPLGGQTKIAYTQDPSLHALEVTDLVQGGHRSTAAFFLGTKPEYPRRMHTIQGSDSHRLRTDNENKKNLGVGDRATEFLLPQLTFEALKELFLGNDFARTRPHKPAAEAVYDFILQARVEGPSIVQGFHDGMAQRGGARYAVIADVCALANTNGGTLYIGVSADPKQPPVGVTNAAAQAAQLEKEIKTRISPAITCEVDTQETVGKTILRVLVPRGDDPPYAVDDNKIYVREEAETGLAVRDEIVLLVRRGLKQALPSGEAALAPAAAPAHEARPPAADGGSESPRTGVEVVGVEERDGTRYYAMRDLRNGNLVKNVTRSSARRLWHYAISQYERLPADLGTAKVQWLGELGVIGEQKRGKGRRFDLAHRTPQGTRVFFGVTEDGIHGEWKRLVGGEAE